MKPAVRQLLLSGTALAPYTGVVATKCMVPGAQETGFTQMQGKSVHVAMDNISSLQLVYCGWYTQNPAANAGVSEVNASNTSTYTASIEYPAGTRTQVTFSGVAAGTAAPGATLISDACVVHIPLGETFWVHVFQTNPTVVLGVPYAASTGRGELCNLGAGALTDLTMAGTITNGQPGQRCPPAAIIATTTKPTFALFGDSRAFGSGDSINDATILQGEVERSLGRSFAFLNLCRGGERVSHAVAGSAAKRIPLAAYASHVFCQYGTNDLQNTRTAAQIKADIATFKAMIPGGKPFYYGTCSPVSSSTDSFATTVNQTTHSSNAQRILHNASVRSGMDGIIDGYVELSDWVESVRDSGIWKAPSYTSDGVHGLVTAYSAIKDSGSYDDLTRRVSRFPKRW